MPMFFFHLRNISGDKITDYDGVSLADVSAALQSADMDACEMVSNAVKFGSKIHHDEIEITDITGELVAVVRLRAVANDIFHHIDLMAEEAGALAELHLKVAEAL